MIFDVCVDTLADVLRGRSVVSTVRGHFDNPPLNDVLCAADVREAKLDRDAFGHIFPEIKLAVALQVLRSIRDEQIGASAAVKALAEATIEVIS